MNICIITRIDYSNYGNRLQNYALSMLLENEGWNVLSGVKLIAKDTWINSSKGIKKKIKQTTPFGLFRLWQIYNQEAIDRLNYEHIKMCNLRRFTQIYIPTLPPLIVRDASHLTRTLRKYHFDYYIAGSDQVWNPYFGGKDYEFLTFATQEKRLSFAASFGVSEIPDALRERYRILLNQMKYISVREAKAVDIVQMLTGRNDVHWTPDPTLLLERSAWDELAAKATIDKPAHYIATYFLGEIPPAVEMFAKLKNLPLMKMNCKQQPELNDIGVEDFLSVLRSADYVLTDSFHGMAFSIKFHREFFVFRRVCKRKDRDMFSRLENTLTLLGLEMRIQEDNAVHDGNRIDPKKWREIDVYYADQRQIAMQNLKVAMGIRIKDED